jgi:membrane peptidoglycan carboxypeptidase
MKPKRSLHEILEDLETIGEDLRALRQSQLGRTDDLLADASRHLDAAMIAIEDQMLKEHDL